MGIEVRRNYAAELRVDAWSMMSLFVTDRDVPEHANGAQLGVLSDMVAVRRNVQHQLYPMEAGLNKALVSIGYQGGIDNICS